MTVHEMQIDLLSRYYKAVGEAIQETTNTKDIVKILHEACTLFGFSLARIEKDG